MILKKCVNTSTPISFSQNLNHELHIFYFCHAFTYGYISGVEGSMNILVVTN